MNATNHQSVERDGQGMEADRKELVERIAQVVCEDGVVQPLPGLHLARVSAPLEKLHSVPEPSFCIIAQGSKETFLGDTRYQYDPFNYLLTTIKLPRVSRVLEASTERPYLSLRLELSPTLVGSIMIETGHIVARSQTDMRAIGVSPLDVNLLDAVVRLVRLLDTPADVPLLRPLVTREIIYRLLIGEQGDKLCHLTGTRGNASSIVRAVELLRQDFAQSIRIEDMAQELGMSVSGFHHHFKAVTAMSPLQFQKRLRLQEARRLMLDDDLDAASAAYRVGYNDASHFNREYKKFFGDPPMRDVQRLRKEVH